jgi:hypothetical protein
MGCAGGQSIKLILDPGYPIKGIGDISLLGIAVMTYAWTDRNLEYSVYMSNTTSILYCTV